MQGKSFTGQAGHRAKMKKGRPIDCNSIIIQVGDSLFCGFEMKIDLVIINRFQSPAFLKEFQCFPVFTLLK